MNTFPSNNSVYLSILGTSASIPTSKRDNTSIAFLSKDETILVDCSSAPFRKLESIGVQSNTLRNVIITHTHVDHMYGIPSLIHALWLNGHQSELTFHCLAETKPTLENLLNAFGLYEKDGMFPIKTHILPSTEYADVLSNNSFTVQSSPVRHNVPNIGIRVTEKISGKDKIVVYSCDTEPCESLIRLAQNADILIQECAFTSDVKDHRWHTTGVEAGEIASEASVRELILVHIDPSAQDKTDVLRGEAQRNFTGTVKILDDLSTISFDE